MKRRDFIKNAGLLLAGATATAGAGAAIHAAKVAKTPKDRTSPCSAVEEALATNGIAMTVQSPIMEMIVTDVLPTLTYLQKSAPKLGFEFKINPTAPNRTCVDIVTNIPGVNPFDEKLSSGYDPQNPLTIRANLDEKGELYLMAENGYAQRRGMKNILDFIIVESQMYADHKQKLDANIAKKTITAQTKPPSPSIG